MLSNYPHFTKEDMRRRTEAFFSFCEQQGWPAPLLQQPAPLRGRYYYSVSNGSDFALIWFSASGGIDVNASAEGTLKSKLLQWIEQEQPNSAALRRERTARLLSFSPTSTQEPGITSSSIPAEEEVTKFATQWAILRFGIPQSERGKIEVAVEAYREIGSAKDFGKATGIYFVSLHIPGVKPTVYLKLFNGKDLLVEAVAYEQS